MASDVTSYASQPSDWSGFNMQRADVVEQAAESVDLLVGVFTTTNCKQMVLGAKPSKMHNAHLTRPVLFLCFRCWVLSPRMCKVPNFLSAEEAVVQLLFHRRLGLIHE